jgi:electron transfer flavoprotein alpha subunit
MFVLATQASTLVVSHASGNATPHTLASCVEAAHKLDGGVDVLLAGSGEGLGEAAAEASKLHGVESVILADHSSLQHQLAEPTAALIKEVVAQ